jgi:hypothetical protein
MHWALRAPIENTKVSARLEIWFKNNLIVGAEKHFIQRGSEFLQDRR